MRNFNPFSIPDEILKQRLLEYLKDDIGFGDISSGIIPDNAVGNARIFAKSNGILAGLKEAEILFGSVGIKAEAKKNDGDYVKEKDVILVLKGNIRAILTVERVALNFLMRMSSIASTTYDYMKVINEYASKVRTHNGISCKIAATRKTTPGFGFFEKKAVYLGGGDTHRWNLSDMILIKDTHRAFYNEDIHAIIRKVKEQVSFSKKIEVELEDLSKFPDAIEAGADIIMFDNQKPEDIKDAIESVSIPKHIILEASGNITRENLVDYVLTGVNIISTSELTLHPHITMDFSLRLY